MGPPGSSQHAVLHQVLGLDRCLAQLHSSCHDKDRLPARCSRLRAIAAYLGQDRALPGLVCSSVTPSAPGSTQGAILHQAHSLRRLLAQQRSLICSLPPCGKGGCQPAALHKQSQHDGQRLATVQNEFRCTSREVSAWSPLQPPARWQKRQPVCRPAQVGFGTGYACQYTNTQASCMPSCSKGKLELSQARMPHPAGCSWRIRGGGSVPASWLLPDPAWPSLPAPLPWRPPTCGRQPPGWPAGTELLKDGVHGSVRRAEHPDQTVCLLDASAPSPVKCPGHTRCYYCLCRPMSLVAPPAGCSSGLSRRPLSGA